MAGYAADADVPCRRDRPDRRLARDHRTPGPGQRVLSGDPPLYLEEDGKGGLAFRSAPLGDDVVLAGVPTLQLSASVSVPRVHLIANLYDEDAEGNRRRITQCALERRASQRHLRLDPGDPGER